MCDGCNPTESKSFICCNMPEAIACLAFDVSKYKI